MEARGAGRAVRGRPDLGLLGRAGPGRALRGGCGRAGVGSSRARPAAPALPADACLALQSRAPLATSFFHSQKGKGKKREKERGKRRGREKSQAGTAAVTRTAHRGALLVGRGGERRRLDVGRPRPFPTQSRPQRHSPPCVNARPRQSPAGLGCAPGTSFVPLYPARHGTSLASCGVSFPSGGGESSEAA